MEATPKQIREARGFLQSRGIGTAEISPRDFAQAAEQFNKSFAKTLEIIAYLKMRSAGLYPETKQALKEAAGD